MAITLIKAGCAGVAMCCAVAFSSCGDDGYSVRVLPRDWVTVHVEGDGEYSFTGDRWGTMWPVSSVVGSYRPVEGERAVLYFSPLSENYYGYDWAVKSELLYTVLTKPVERLTQENEEMFANHPAYVNQIWIAGGYLNLIFTQKTPASRKHRVSLVYTSARPEVEEDGFIHLEYRYNTYGDTLGNVRRAAVCYNLNTLPLNEASGIKLKLNSGVSGERTLTFTDMNESEPEEAKDMDWERRDIQ